MNASDLISASPAIPVDSDGPAFAGPWQARVFAMTLQTHEAGVFSWGEWAEALGAQLAADPDGKTDYYNHWLAALEALLTAKGIASAGLLHELRNAWDTAAKATPHGLPIELRLV